MTNFYGSEIYLSNDELLDTTASRREEDMMLDELSGNENDATEVKNILLRLFTPHDLSFFAHHCMHKSKFDQQKSVAFYINLKLM